MWSSKFSHLGRSVSSDHPEMSPQLLNSQMCSMIYYAKTEGVGGGRRGRVGGAVILERDTFGVQALIGNIETNGMNFLFYLLRDEEKGDE